MSDGLGIVVVHHRSPVELDTCLQRLGRFAHGADVVLVDTAPDERVLAGAVRRLPGVRILRAPNHSLAHAVNLGLRSTRSPLVVHMNADVFVEHDTLPRLVDALRRHPQAGIAGPLCLTPAGVPQDLGPLYAPHYLRLRLRPAGSVRAPWLSGCMQLVRREVLQAVGGLDPSLRFYNEDLDFCLRARRAGFGCRLVDAPVVHVGGSATPSSHVFQLEGRRGGLQISRRYAPPWVRRLHAAALALESGAGRVLARDPERRALYRELRGMLRAHGIDTSPFGTTLDEPRSARRGRA